LKKPADLDITVRATFVLDMPTKMLALAVEVTEASLRECIMDFDWAVTAPIAWSRSARPTDDGGPTYRGRPEQRPGAQSRNAALDERPDLLRSREMAVRQGPEYLTK
jgi:hypothetical protein